MIKSKKIIRQLFYALIGMMVTVLYTQPLSAQNTDWNLSVTGRVIDKTEGGKMSNATINVLKNGVSVQTITSSRRGKFEVKLPPNGDYILVFSKSGYVSKRISVNTNNVPKEDAKYGFSFPMEVNLFQKIEDIDFSVLDQPIGKINYSKSYGAFDYDPEYTKSIKNKVSKLMREYEKKAEVLAARKEKIQKEYDAAINTGDKALANNDFDGAKTAYLNASQLKPDDPVAKEKLNEVKNKLKNKNNLQDQYLAQIGDADKAFKAEDFEKARKIYTSASGLKPDEAYPKSQLKAIKEKLEGIEKTNEQYKALISNADSFFDNEDLENAKNNYQKASKLKPDEQYPKDKLKKISDLLAAQDQNAEKYNQLITQADQSFSIKSWKEAIASYQQAHNLKPDNNYPQDQINIIHKSQAEEAELEKQYKGLITDADQYFQNKKYNQAKSNYKSALALIADKSYPQQQLEKINTLMQAQSKEQEKYNSYIDQGDNAFANKKWQAAKQAYNNALTIKSDEEYPTQRIKTIEGKINATKQKSEEYNQIIASADKEFSNKSYTKARDSYQQALKIFPDKTYPQEQLSKIDAQNSAQEKKQERYKKLIAQADNSFKLEKYNDAKQTYENALAILPDEKYPKEQLKAVESKLQALDAKDKLTAEAEAKQKEYYKALINKADNALSKTEYQSAIKSYKQALTVIDDKEYPKNQIEKINVLIEKQKKDQAEINEKYKKYITLADKSYTLKTYQDALKNYKAASNLKPQEQYPKDRIEKINGLMAVLETKQNKQKRLDEEYNSIISKADDQFSTEDYEQAKKSYTEALGIKQNETYPKDRLAKIELLLKKKQAEERKALADKQKDKKLQEKYDAVIKNADDYYKQKAYPLALEEYNNALTIIPNKEYPANQIDQIKKIQEGLASNKSKADEKNEKAEKYNFFIGLADRAFNIEAYNNANNNYKKALEIKPNEQYPQNRIDSIKILLAQLNKPKKDNKKNIDPATIDNSKEVELDKKYASIHEQYLENKNNFYKKETKEVQEYRNKLVSKHKDLLQKNYKKTVEETAEQIAQMNKDGDMQHQKMIAQEKEFDQKVKTHRENFNKNYLSNRKESMDALADIADKMSEMDKRGRKYNTQNNEELEKIAQRRQQKNNNATERHEKEIASNYKHLVNDRQAEIAASHQALLKKHQQDISHLNVKIEAYKDYMSDKKVANNKTREENYEKALARRKSIQNRRQKNSKNPQKNYEKLKYEENSRSERKGLLARLFKKKIKNNYDAMESQEKDINTKRKMMTKHQRTRNVAAIQYTEEKNKKMYNHLSKQEELNHETEMKRVEKQADQIAQRGLKAAERSERIASRMADNEKKYQLYSSNLMAQHKEKIKSYHFNKYRGEEATIGKSELADEYPVGITEKTEKVSNATVLKRIVVNSNGSAHVYQKIYYHWGKISYKKDDDFTTEEVWDKTFN